MTLHVRDHRNEEPPIRNGKRSIPRGTYLRATTPRHGPAVRRPSVAAIARTPGMRARVTTPAGAVAAPLPPPQVVGGQDAPAGFGRQLNWVGEEDFAVVAFINTADDLGLCVSGVRDGDTFELVSGTGLASFSADTVNNGIAGLIGVVEVGAGIAATAFGLPEVLPLIRAASDFAQRQFPESEHPSRPRDPFGVNPDGGGRARQEGGVIICEPQAQGLYYSASDEHQDRWIQPDGTRDDSNRPRHIPTNDAFFIRQHMGPERLHGTGDLLMCAWDFDFPDNAGFYRLNFILRRDDRDTTTPIE